MPRIGLLIVLNAATVVAADSFANLETVGRAPILLFVPYWTLQLTSAVVGLGAFFFVPIVAALGVSIAIIVAITQRELHKINILKFIATISLLWLLPTIIASPTHVGINLAPMFQLALLAALMAVIVALAFIYWDNTCIHFERLPVPRFWLALNAGIIAGWLMGSTVALARAPAKIASAAAAEAGDRPYCLYVGGNSIKSADQLTTRSLLRYRGSGQLLVEAALVIDDVSKRRILVWSLPRKRFGGARRARLILGDDPCHPEPYLLNRKAVLGSVRLRG